MDSETRFQLLKGISQEIVTEQELRELVDSGRKLTAYDGFEPSGLAHLPIGIYRPLILKDLQKADVKFTLLLADSYSWINEKLGGDLEKIRLVGKYFIEVWKAAGLGTKKITVRHHMDFFEDPEYWKTVLLVAKNHTEARTKRALQIAGRKENEVRQAAQLFYPSMQTADVLYMNVDICQLGMDQRKANILAREVAEKLGRKKPVALHHRMLLGLDGMSSASVADEASIDREIDAKMSKSKPNTCIFVHDSAEEIAKKINSAFCPLKVVQGNPILEYSREIIFRANKEMKIERPQKFGGDLAYTSYADLEKDFAAGKLHPADLKKSVSQNLDLLIAPTRSHFEKTPAARRMFEQIKGFEVTR